MALRTRVFIDQVWITEYGRRMLDASATTSMYMYADGSSQPAVTWLGPLLAEICFRVSSGLVGFRVLAALAAVVLSFAVLRLAQRSGASTGMATLIAAAWLFDASMVQSVVLGRADTLAMAMLFGGMLIAAHGADGKAGLPRWWCVGLGYGLCALARISHTPSLQRLRDVVSCGG
ncbi:MAG: hypothetical protein KDI66_15520 [Xanthomonadales bacterium]|nr:hypothetical protein [Xanthomonadales bacterium]